MKLSTEKLEIARVKQAESQSKLAALEDRWQGLKQEIAVLELAKGKMVFGEEHAHSLRVDIENIVTSMRWLPSN